MSPINRAAFKIEKLRSDHHIINSNFSLQNHNSNESLNEIWNDSNGLNSNVFIFDSETIHSHSKLNTI